jgi:hypothetical protein
MTMTKNSKSVDPMKLVTQEVKKDEIEETKEEE